jgi:hypothetical protein
MRADTQRITNGGLNERCLSSLKMTTGDEDRQTHSRERRWGGWWHNSAGDQQQSKRRPAVRRGSGTDRCCRPSPKTPLRRTIMVMISYHSRDNKYRHFFESRIFEPPQHLGHSSDVSFIRLPSQCAPAGSSHVRPTIPRCCRHCTPSPEALVASTMRATASAVNIQKREAFPDFIAKLIIYESSVCHSPVPSLLPANTPNMIWYSHFGAATTTFAEAAFFCG